MSATPDLAHPYQFVTSGAINATFTSGAIDLLQQHPKAKKICIQAYAAGSTPAGTFTLQHSLNGTNYVTLAGTSQAITNDADVEWQIEAGALAYLQLKYTRSSGGSATGLNAFIYVTE